jgi:hypothetical protein
MLVGTLSDLEIISVLLQFLAFLPQLLSHLLQHLGVVFLLVFLALFVRLLFFVILEEKGRRFILSFLGVLEAFGLAFGFRSRSM